MIQLILRSFCRQAGEVFLDCWVNEVIWPIPFLLLLALAGLMGSATQLAAPYIYTL